MKAPRGQTIVIKLGKFRIRPSAPVDFRARRSAMLPAGLTHRPGTSSIVDEETRQPHLPILSVVVETAVKLREEGHKVIIVSSGAIGVGMRHMNLDKRPKRLATLQVRDVFRRLLRAPQAPPPPGLVRGRLPRSFHGQRLTYCLARLSRLPVNASLWPCGTACSAICGSLSRRSYSPEMTSPM